MSKQKEERGVIILIFFIFLMVVVSRFYVLLAEFVNKFILLWSIYLWFACKRKISVSPEVKGYIKAYIIFALFVIPSIFLSNNPQAGITDFFHMWIWP